MIKLIKIIFSLLLVLYLFVFVSAESNSTQVTVQNGRAVDDEARRRRKRFQFGHQLWCKLKNSVRLTVGNKCL